MSPKTLFAHPVALAALLLLSLAFTTSCVKDTVSPDTNASSTTASIQDTVSTETLNATGTITPTYVTSKAINLNGAHDITIKGKSINGGSTPCITLTNCYDIRIVANKLYNSTNVGVYLYRCKNITVVSNYITHVSTGVYVVQTTDGGIAIDSNQFLNMQGPLPRGQFVQFDNVNGANNSITKNRGENILGQSYPEDAISLFQSNGTPTSPIKVNSNWIRGGGPSTSGGGIMLGDGGGSYLLAYYNTLVNPGQYGMAISGGEHNSIAHNTIYSESQSFSNVGIYVESMGSAVTKSTVSENKVNFFNSSRVSNGAWLAPGIITPTGWDTNIWGDKNITNKVLPAVIITLK